MAIYIQLYFLFNAVATILLHHAGAINGAIAEDDEDKDISDNAKFVALTIALFLFAFPAAIAVLFIFLYRKK